ncbi:hypothetical protein SISNIDRAFT_488287 [Sistotremastrum niveocremeum HHB9708]|uniref:Uncharacterized protein n=1 Tax=Sistotremastrum niveocremeum HHB9708 TaxID=1314777 RepID=A0A164RAU8_9AGAM|nr:hypothetical protein SISNIDRAFT_488287 [Sistotremastrum niveocremeum HHB9708]
MFDLNIATSNRFAVERSKGADGLVMPNTETPASPLAVLPPITLLTGDNDRKGRKRLVHRSSLFWNQRAFISLLPSFFGLQELLPAEHIRSRRRVDTLRNEFRLSITGEAFSYRLSTFSGLRTFISLNGCIPSSRYSPDVSEIREAADIMTIYSTGAAVAT